MKNINQIEKIRHSLAHILAQAVLELWPDAKLGIGPATKDGFYYDFEFKKEFPEENLKKLEEKMRELILRNQSFVKKIISKDKAKKIFKNQPYKLEILKELKGKNVSVFETGEFIDLCKGPHIKKTSEINIKAFKLNKIAGAYWKGDEKNKMLTRIYGLAFETEKELVDYLKLLDEAEKRDHRILGPKLKIFFFSEMTGPGLPLWLPNGAIIIEEIEKLAKEMERKAGYLRVKTPHIAKEIMYKTSGHLPYYAESMFPPMMVKEEGTKYYLKAMNCPHHHQIYAAEPRSYKDLPLRLAEYGTCYRYEKSGELFGLMRVRSIQMNDAHIYCTEEQFKEEFLNVIKLYYEYFKIFDIKKYEVRLSTHSKEGLGKKYIDNEKLWKKTEGMIRNVLIKERISFQEKENEAAFYGPKIDIQIWSAIGKEFTLATNQVDFAVPARFGLIYTDKDGKKKTPLCIHRAPLSSHERLIGFLIEHYGGAFPTWLSPTQVVILPVSEKHLKFSQKVENILKENEVRVELKGENETLNKRIREAELQKIPYILIIGEKEISSNKISLRKRKEGDKGQISLEKFIEQIKKEIKERRDA